MDQAMEYEKKFAEMQKYIPFLESMINRLESTQSGSNNPREAQLIKIRALRNLLLDKNKRMKMDNLLKCEQVMLNLYSKVGEADMVHTSPMSDIEIKKEAIEPKSEPAVDLQAVRQKLKIMSNVKDVKSDLTPAVQTPITQDPDCAAKTKGATPRPLQVRSEVHAPHLFERRPRRVSKSKSNSPSHNRIPPTGPSPPNVKMQRKYTRVLCSPENDRRRWDSNSPQKTYDSNGSALFQRRSPRMRKSRSHSPRKSKKKSHRKDRSLSRPNRDSSSCSQQNVNITLNVPEESLNSLSASDIFERIVNCNENDVDIKHLRELRSQIVKELRQTGANQDISDYILKSYKKKKKKRTKVEEIEEGELSDSESESLQKIYGNMIVEVKSESSKDGIFIEPMSNVKINPNIVIEEEQNRKDSPKIKISLTISNAKDNLENTRAQEATKPITTFLLDVSNKEDKVGESGSVTRITGQRDTVAPPFFYGELQIDENASKEHASTTVMTGSTSQPSHCNESNLECTNPIISQKNCGGSTNANVNTTDPTSDLNISSTIGSNSIVSDSKEDEKKTVASTIPNSKSNTISEQLIQSTHCSTLKHIANSIEAVSKPKEFYVPLTDVQEDKDLTDLLYKDLSPSNSPLTGNTTTYIEEHSRSSKNDTNYHTCNPSDQTPADNQSLQKSNEVLPSISKEAKEREKNENKNTGTSISEIDILKALKSEILGESSDVIKTAAETPSLHQPKISKVIDKSQLEANKKKRISLENYKKKVAPAQKGLFVRQAEKEQAKLLSRALTPRECERFQMILKDPLDETGISDDDSPIDADSGLNKSDDMGPKSPEEDNFSDSSPESPVIIPSDPIQNDDNTAFSQPSKQDVDMRILNSSQSQSPQVNTTCPITSPRQFPNLPQMETRDGLFNECQRSGGFVNSLNNRNPDFPVSANYKGRNPKPILGHRPEAGLSKPCANPSLLGSPAMHPSMTPSRNPIMTPSRNHSMTPSRVLMTPSYTPMYDEMPARRHVYAPFELPDPVRTPLWDISSPVYRDDGSSTPIREYNDPRTASTRDIPGTPLWDNLGGRSPMINDSANEFGFCTPRHDIAEYNRPFDPVSANNADTTYNRNRAPRDPRLRTERREEVYPQDARTHSYSHCNRPVPETSFDSRNFRQSFQNESNWNFDRDRDEVNIARDPSSEYHNFNTGRPVCRESSVGRNFIWEQSVGRNMGCEPSIGRNMGREPSVGRNMVREASVGRNMVREQSVGRNMIREQSVGRNMGREQSVGRNMVREPSVGRNFIREPSVGRNMAREPSIGPNMGREPSVGRNFIREPSVGRNIGRELGVEPNVGKEPSVRRNMGREHNVGRNIGPEDDFGRIFDRDQSVERNTTRRPNVGRNMGRAQSVGRNLGHERHFYHNMDREQIARGNIDHELGMGRNMNRGRSVGRDIEYELGLGHNKNRGRSVGRDVEYSTRRVFNTEHERSIKSQPNIGRNVRREPSIERGMRREASDSRNIRREQNVDRKFDREPSIGRNFKRGQSVGPNIRLEPSVERNIVKESRNRSDSGTNQIDDRRDSKRREDTSVRRKDHEKIESIERERSDRSNVRVLSSNNRDPRSRRDLHEFITKDNISNKSPSECSSSQMEKSNVRTKKYDRFKSRDKKHARETDKYRGGEERSAYGEERRKHNGIHYSSDNIAKGTTVVKGYGVKNYKIPKIKRPAEELAKEEKNKLGDLNDKIEQDKITTKNTSNKDNRHKHVRRDPPPEISTGKRALRKRPPKRKRIIELKSTDVEHYSSVTSEDSEEMSSELEEILSKIKQNIRNSVETDEELVISPKTVHSDENETSLNNVNTNENKTFDASPSINIESKINESLATCNATISSKMDASVADNIVSMSAPSLVHVKMVDIIPISTPTLMTKLDKPTPDLSENTTQSSRIGSNPSTTQLELDNYTVSCMSPKVDHSTNLNVESAILPTSLPQEDPLANNSKLVNQEASNKQESTLPAEIIVSPEVTQRDKQTASPANIQSNTTDETKFIEKNDEDSIRMSTSTSLTLNKESENEIVVDPKEKNTEKTLEEMTDATLKLTHIESKQNNLATDCSDHAKNIPINSETASKFNLVSENVSIGGDKSDSEKSNSNVGNTNTNYDPSIPDSTIRIEGSEETNQEIILPDSTQTAEMHTDASSVVSSSRDITKDDEKETAAKIHKNDHEMEAIKSLGSILSVLQDKTKMKHILTLLSDDSAETEKLKRKLAKLSEIESDEEAEPENLVQSVTQRENLAQLSDSVLNATSHAPDSVQTAVPLSLGGPEMPAVVECENEPIVKKVPLEISSVQEFSAVTECRENEPIAEKPKLVPNSPKTQKLQDKEDLQLAVTLEGREIPIISKNTSPSRSPTKKISTKLKTPTRQAQEAQVEIPRIILSKAQHDTRETELETQTESLILKNKKKRKFKATMPLRVKKPTERRMKKIKAKVKKIPSSNAKRITRSDSAQKGSKKKNELQKLQEDIRDMFISQGVLNATGIRMCRLAKLTDDKSDQSQSQSEDHDISPKHIDKKVQKDCVGTSKKCILPLTKDPKPLVLLEKTQVSDSIYDFKITEDELQDKQYNRTVALPPKIRKKPGPKPRPKMTDGSSVAEVAEKKTSLSKPGPKSKKKSFKTSQEPLENTIAESNLKSSAEPLESSFDSDDESLSSLISAGSSERLTEFKPKPKRKNMWQRGLIKSKKKCNKDTSIAKTMKIPDETCFTDRKYCFTQGSKKYICRLCNFEGEDIVLHCKQAHPHQEVPLSRINPKTSASAIEQSLNTDFDTFQKTKTAAICRFCFQVFEGKSNLEKFFWHVVSKHTGEYKYSCSECTDEDKCSSLLDIPTPPSEGQNLLLGYICGECHYTQISLNNLKTHVALRHDNEETEVYTINLCDMPASDKVIPAAANKGKSNKTNEESPPLRQLRPRIEANISESDSPKVRKSIGEMGTTSLVSEKKRIKPTRKKNSKIKIRFEGDSNDEITHSEHFESSSETVKSERDDIDVPELDTITSENYDNSSSRRSSVGSDLRLVSENDEFVDYLRRVQIKQEQVEEQHQIVESSNEYDKSPHFMITVPQDGTKSQKLYVCRVKGCGNGYRTPLLIALKMHVQSKHLGWRDIWDGYCCVCNQVISETSSRSSRNYSDCLSHMLMRHLDEFPVQEEAIVAENSTGKTSTDDNTSATNSSTNADRSSINCSATKKYISVKPITDLIASIEEPRNELDESVTAVPRIQSVVSLKNASEPAESQATHTLETAADSMPSECVPRDAKTMEPLSNPIAAMNIVMTEKHPVVRENMLEPSKLACVFKCAGRYCSFAARGASVFAAHINAHLKTMRDQSDVLRCAYCEWTPKGAEDLAAHVLSEHGHCRYSCSLCWYLTTMPVLVELHSARAHPSHPRTQPLALQPPNPDDGAAATRGVLQRIEVVPLYTCSMQTGPDARACSFRGYTAPKYLEHLQLRHDGATEFQCPTCSDKFPRANGLVGHLKRHGLGLYQCTYCLCGADTEQELMEHAALYHPARKPQAYLRHIFEAKDASAPGMEKKFKSLPLMRLGQQGLQKNVIVFDAPINTTNDCPNTEAERAHALEKLILQHQDTPMSSASSDEDLRSGADKVAEEDTQKILPQVSDTTNRKTNEPSAQKNSENTIDARITQVKKEPTDAEKSSKNLKTNADLKKISDEYIICLDSDEEEQKQTSKRPASPKAGPAKIQKTTGSLPVGREEDADVIQLSDEETPSETLHVDTLDPEVRYCTDKLFKCQKCLEKCKNDYYYRQHLIKCYPNPDDQPKCPYCPTVSSSRKEIRIHLIQAHGPIKTYRCSICQLVNTQSKVLVQHMHVEHNVANVTINIESPSSDTANMKYIVHPETSKKRVSKGRVRSMSPKPHAKPGPKPRNKQTQPPNPKPIVRYGPEDIDRLPHNPILDDFIQCSRCEFGTKVRSNMIRHLQMHANEQSVPSATPLNPVPHLESNEMHFDKMTNLAASSNLRPTVTAIASSLPPATLAKYPKYIPDKDRNVCGAVGCSYISLDESLLKYHWETLHSDLRHGPGVTTYRCVHCPVNQMIDTSQPLTASRIVGHLKMHDSRLYGCSDCPYYHYQLVHVERHAVKKHGSSARGVIIIREPGDSTTHIQAPTVTQATDPKTAPTMDLKPWQCGVCKFKTMLRPEVVEHCNRAHGFKFQFKCAFCPYSGSVHTSVARHQSERHVGRLAPDVLYVYYKERSLPADEEGKPLWIKQRQFLDSLGEKADVKAENGEQSNTTNTTSTLASAIVISSTPIVDLAIVKNEFEEETSKEADSTKDSTYVQLGKMGDPKEHMYLCPLCKVTTETHRSAFITHLHEELNYRRFSCNMCSYRTFTKQRMLEHSMHEHKQSQDPILLPSDIEIDLWIDKLLKHQDNIILANKKAKEEADKAAKEAANKAANEADIANRLANEMTDRVAQEVILRAANRVTNEFDQTQSVPKGLTPQFNQGEGPSIEVVRELETLFGPMGVVANGQDFACPKCDFRTPDENNISQHLEMELAKIRWACSSCSQKYQHYHEAQRHCSTVKHNAFAHVTSVSKDPLQRTLWIDSVIAAQRKQAAERGLTSSKSEVNTIESSDSVHLDTSNNSLLVARYEEDVTTPIEQGGERRKQQPGRKRKPTCLREDDSDEEPRLVIADKVVGMHSCPHCEYRCNNGEGLRSHMLRHFNMKPFTCGYCPFSSYKATLIRHLKGEHPDLPRKWVRNVAPKSAALQADLPMPKTTKFYIAKNSESDSPTVSPASSKASVPGPSNKVSKTSTAPSEEATSICLLCELEVLPSKATMHHKVCHPLDDEQQIVERGTLVYKCGTCMSLCTDMKMLTKHHEVKHKGTEMTSTLSRAGCETREAFVCDYCNRMFTFLKDLKCHHNTTHSSFQLMYSKKACGKRKLEEDDIPIKRVAKKSTTKLPFAMKNVARKSTTKLPFSEPDIEEISSDDDEEYSYYGTRREPVEKFGNIKTQMPFFGTMMPVTVEKLSGLINISPVVLVRDYKKNSK